MVVVQYKNIMFNTYFHTIGGTAIQIKIRGDAEIRATLCVSATALYLLPNAIYSQLFAN